MNMTISRLGARADELFKAVRDERSIRILNVEICKILPCPFSPMPLADFDEVGIVSLADSIRQHGLLNPITVRKKVNTFSAEGAASSDERYEIIAGERRFRAMKMLGKDTVPCIIIEADDVESAQMAMVENIMRKNLNMFEYAAALEALLREYGLRQEELAAKMSTSQPNIANKLRLLRFSEEERMLIVKNGLTERHARAILRIKNEEKRKDVLLSVISEELDLKETELLVERIISENDPRTDRGALADRLYAYVRSLVSEMSKKGCEASAVRRESDSEIRITVVIPKELT